MVDGDGGPVDEGFIGEVGGAVDSAAKGVAGDAGDDGVGEVLGLSAAGETQGEVRERLRAEAGADLRGVCLDAREFRADFDGFGGGTEFELGVDAENFGDFQGEIGAGGLAEAIGFEADLVGTDGEVGTGVLAGAVGGVSKRARVPDWMMTTLTEGTAAPVGSVREARSNCANRDGTVSSKRTRSIAEL